MPFPPWPHRSPRVSMLIGWSLVAALTGCGDGPSVRESAAPPAADAAGASDPFAGADRLTWERLARAVVAGDRQLAAHRAMIDAASAYHRRVKGGASLASLQAARCELAAARRQALLEARAHLGEWWMARRSLAIAHEVGRLIADLADTASAAASSGGDTRAVIEAAMLAGDLEREELMAKREARSHQLAIAALVGRPGLDVPPPVDDLGALPPVAAAPALASWSRELPAVLLARARMREAEAGLALAERSIYPPPTAMAPGMDMDDYPPRPIPLERRTAVIEQWRALVREREAEMAEAAATSETEAMSALAHLEECAATQVLLQRQAGNLGHAAELARSGFIAGTVPLSGVLQARRAVLDLQRAQAVTARDAFVTSGSLIDLDPADPVGADGGAKP